MEEWKPMRGSQGLHEAKQEEKLHKKMEEWKPVRGS
jgi:hypothetical protein